MMITQIWAHRGASKAAPENTMPAFAEAIRVGADGLEFDVQRTADGHLVVVHDETCNRVTGQPGWICKLTLAELRQFNFASTHARHPFTPLPTLAEVFDLVKPTGLQINVELKNGLIAYEGLENEAIALADSFGMTDRIIYSSFNHYSMREIRKSRPDIRCGLLYECGLVDPWLYAQRVGVTAIHPSLPNLQIPDLVSQCHDAGLAINAWTIDDPHWLRKAMSLGIDAVITNVPDLAVQVRTEREA